jgi:hypothetical protein
MQALQGAMRRSFEDSDRTYGARRVRRDLRAWGIRYRCARNGSSEMW